MAHIDEVLRRLGSDYTHGYGPAPIPSIIDSEVSELVALLVAANGPERHDVLCRMAEVHGFVLVAFAERMASYAVRRQEPGLIARSLSALAIAVDLLYVKEALPVVSLLYRSIQKLGLDPRDVFADNGGYGNAVLDRFLGDFLRRSDEDRTVEAMGYVEGSDPDGFRYKRTW